MRRLIATLALLTATAASADHFFVDRNDDGSGPNTLRWAIEQVNATPATIETRSTISVDAAMTVSPERELPAVMQPAVLNLTKLRLDGARTSGASGLTIAADDVSLAGLTVSNFGVAGILLRGQRNIVEHCESSANGTGIVIHGNLNAIYDTVVRSNLGHGIHVAADAKGTTLGELHYFCPMGCSFSGPNTISSNHGDGIHADGDFTRIRGSQIDHNSGDGIAAAATAAIAGCDVSFNRGNGITARVPLAELTGTAGECNGRLFLDERGDGPTANDPGDFDDVTNAPHLDSAVDDLTAVTVAGTLEAKPSTTYAIDFMALAPACDDGAHSIGTRDVVTDSHGFASFRSALYKADALFGARVASVAATARLVSDSPPITFTYSELSAPVDAVENRDHRVDLAVTVSAPPAAQQRDRIIVEIHITNRGPAALGFLLRVPHVPGASYDGGTTTSGTCYLSAGSPAGTGFCGIGPLASGESATVRNLVTMPAANGLFSYRAEAVLWPDTNDVESNPSDNVAVANVNVFAGPRRRATR